MRSKKQREAASESLESTTAHGRYEVEPGAEPRVAEAVPVGLEPGARVISATEAARNFSDLINRVSYRGETYTVERGGRAICRLSPVEVRGCSGAELLDVLAKLPRPSDEYLSTVDEMLRRQGTVEPSAWEK